METSYCSFKPYGYGGYCPSCYRKLRMHSGNRRFNHKSGLAQARVLANRTRRQREAKTQTVWDFRADNYQNHERW